jgi:hypothetical protein
MLAPHFRKDYHPIGLVAHGTPPGFYPNDWFVEVTKDWSTSPMFFAHELKELLGHGVQDALSGK